MIRLSTEFLPPELYHRLRYGARIDALIEASTTSARYYAVAMDNKQHCARVIDEIDAMMLGTRGYIRIDGGRLQFVTNDDLRVEEEETKKNEESRNRQELARKYQAMERLADNRAFNARLCIPVKWLPGYRIVLSGLLAHSDGTGKRRNTVFHIVLREPLIHGRLHRNAGDLLCSSNRGSFGINGSSNDWTNVDDAREDSFNDRVNCISCLKISARFRQETQ